MKKKANRFLALLVGVVMALEVAPVTAFSATDSLDEPTEVTASIEETAYDAVSEDESYETAAEVPDESAYEGSDETINGDTEIEGEIIDNSDENPDEIIDGSDEIIPGTEDIGENNEGIIENTEENTPEEIVEDLEENPEEIEAVEEAVDLEELAAELEWLNSFEEKTPEVLERIKELEELLAIEPVKEIPKIIFPPQHFIGLAGGVLVNVEAEEDTFPEGTTMKVEEVEIETIIDAVNEALGEDAQHIEKIKAVDITFYDAEGTEIQPLKPVSVKMNAAGIFEEDNRQILHIEEDEETEELVAKVVEDVDTSEKAVEFDAEKFSVYVVVTTGEDARLHIIFKSDDSENAEVFADIYVKESDTIGSGDQDYETVLYDPGIGEIAEGVVFKGWTTNPNYTEEDWNDIETGFVGTIDKVRIAVADWDWDSIDEDDPETSEVTYYPVLFKAFYVSYQDQIGVTLQTDEAVYLLNRNLENDPIKYTVNNEYVPNNPENENFIGWGLLDNNGNFVVVTDPDTHETSHVIYENNDEIDPLTSDIHLRADILSGHWISFRENGGTYTAPEFVENGKKSIGTAYNAEHDSTEATQPDPSKFGYEFDGWYVTNVSYHIDDSGNKITDYTVTDTLWHANTELTENITLTAKWKANTTADFTVIIWKESMLDTYAENVEAEDGERNYDFWKSYKMTGAVGDTISAVTATNNNGSVTDADGTYTNFRIQGTLAAGGTINEVLSYSNSTYQTELRGYHAAKYDTDVTINPEGTAVVNVYYNRNAITYTFYTQGSTSTTSWQLVQDQNSTSTYNGNIYTRRGTSNNYDQYYGTPTYGDGNTYYRRSGNWPNYTYTPLIWKELTITGTGWVQYQYSKGLYSQKLNWPADTNIWWYPNDDFSGSRMTYKGSYLPQTAEQYAVEYYGTQATNANFHIYFWLEDLDGENYTLGYDASVQATSPWYANPPYTGFNINDKFGGYKADHYSVDEGAEQDLPDAPNSEGIYASVDNIYNRLDVYYVRSKASIIFKDGSYFRSTSSGLIDMSENPNPNDLKTTEAVPFDTDLTSYNGGPDYEGEDGANYYVPTPYHDGYVFAGWYTDKSCTKPYTFSAMPQGNIVVYAKWIKVQYRVFLHPNAGTEGNDDKDNSLRYGDSGQSTAFRIDYGDQISNGITISALRDNYELIGWYTDPGFNNIFRFGTFVANTSNASTPYDRTRTTETDKWGEPTEDEDSPDWNKDNRDDRYWVQYQIDLYARWRSKVEGAKGIYVQYVTGDGYFGEDTSAKVYNDPKLYTDKAGANAYAASTAPTAQAGETQTQFKYWVIQEWDEDDDIYKDVTEDGKLKTVLPGDTFTVEKDYSYRVVNEWEDSSGNISETYSEDQYNIIHSATYTMQLRAEYGVPEEETPTHISWYSNFGDGVTTPFHIDTVPDGGTIEDSTLGINEAVPIQPADQDALNRPGYIFKGWAKSSDATEAWIKWDGEKYTCADAAGKNDAVGTVTHVAADENQPYDKLYAVWEAKTYIIVFDKNEGSGIQMTNQEFEYANPLTGKLSKNTYTRENYTFTGWNTAANGSGEHSYADEAALNTLNLDNAVLITEGENAGKYQIKLYAQWTQLFNVTYSYSTEAPAGAEDPPATQQYGEGAQVDVAGEPAAVEGYKFSGWTTTDANVSEGKFTMPGKAVAFTGSWEPDDSQTYTVTYSAVNGTITTDATQTEQVLSTTAITGATAAANAG
ncbi:MAG: InlB B-repeat-containing protein, partial [Firmicutes bacterium]|nr:InlB B-repeat-containing protein [Bacillota bacterium]